MAKKIVALVALLAIAAVIIFKFKAQLFGVVLGSLGSIVYFSLTGSTLNWIMKKK